MYENNNTVSIDWKGLFIKLILVAVIILAIFACYNYFSNKKGINTNSTPTAATQLFNANLESLRQAGENYYDYSNYPGEGQTVMVTLGELITKGNIKELYDANGNECNRENSYVALTNDKGQYKLKASLACGETSNYTVVMIGCDCEENICDKTTKEEEEKKESTNKTNSSSSTKPTTKKTTKKTTVVNNNVAKPTTKATTTTKKTTQVIDMSNTTTTTKPTTTKKTDNLYKVTFDSNGGDYVEPQYVEKYETAYEPDEPEKDDARFVGWYYKGELWDFDNEITKNITLEAYYWETKEITTTVYSSGYDTVGTTFMTVTHKLAIPAALQQNNIKNVRIKRIQSARTLSTSYDLQNYINKHSSTYDGYVHNAGDYYSTNANTLGRLTNIRVQKTYSYTYDRWVTWSALVSNQCYQPFAVNGSNKCSYGIAYNVVWEYDELTD